MNKIIVAIVMTIVAIAGYADGPCGYRPYNYAYNPWREAQSWANRQMAAVGPARSYVYSGSYSHYHSTSSGKYVPNPAPAYVDPSSGYVRQVPVRTTQSAPVYPQQRVNTAYGQITLPAPTTPTTPTATYVQPHYETRVGTDGKAYNVYVPGYYR